MSGCGCCARGYRAASGAGGNDPARSVRSEQSPALTASQHDRLAPGLNHLAFHAGPRGTVDLLAAAGAGHGWTLLFPETHPYAGGPDHYAACLANTDGFEVELVAQPQR
jgi:hypothetical protein